MPGMRILDRAFVVVAVAAAVAGAVLFAGAASAARIVPRYGYRRASDRLTMQSPVFGQMFDPTSGEVPDLLGEEFDPGLFDPIEVAGDGRVIAYASRIDSQGNLGPTRHVVLLPSGEQEVVRLTAGAGDDDQPTLGFDRFGMRVAFRASEGVAGQSDSDIHLHTITRAGEERTSETRNVTRFGAGDDEHGDGTAFDPALVARVRVRDVGSDVKVAERDARLAFVSTGDLDKDGRPAASDAPGHNPDGLPQLFLWLERADRFLQLTRNRDELGELNRPSISASSGAIAFESTADLTPNQQDPRDGSRVGNPAGVRQIYLWRAGRGLRQLTWGDGDCFAPRIAPSGRFVLFSSTADLVPGGNPEGNSEIFAWLDRAGGRLRQMTRTEVGDSVLPRPTPRLRQFAFLTTSVGFGGRARGRFGEASQLTPQAAVFAGRRVRHVHGVSDLVNGGRLAEGKHPILTGPPAPGVNLLKVHFATNDPTFDLPNGTSGSASITNFHVMRATRYRN